MVKELKKGIIECDRCGKNKYGYKGKNRSKFYVCYTCGAFDGKASPEVMEMLLYEPQLLLKLIQEGELKKIE